MRHEAKTHCSMYCWVGAVRSRKLCSPEVDLRLREDAISALELIGRSSPPFLSRAYQQVSVATKVCFYNSRSATATGRNAARIAGSMPPSTPITKAKRTPISSRSKVILKANATLENV